ncbi:hypothetical protein TNCT_393551, partial [Trichonephila clavata]
THSWCTNCAPVANKAHVTAIYCENDSTEIHFTRIVAGSSSEYRMTTNLWVTMNMLVDWKL